jgi:hypothetical protein
MKDQDYQIFEAYLSGDLSEAEVKTHQERLGTDQDYKESFELFQSLNKHLADKFKNDHELAQFKDSVSNVSNEYFESKSKSQFPWIKMAIAACLIVAIGLYFYLGDISKPQYDEIAQIPSIHLTVRSSDNQIYTQAEDAFNEKQYAEAIALFDQILEQESEAQSIKLYQGISYMEMDSIDNARK